MSQFELDQIDLEQIDLAITSPLANQPVASYSECAFMHYQCRSAAMTPQVNLNFVFQSRVSRYLIDFFATETVGIVVSAISIFRMVDNLMPSCLQNVHRYWTMYHAISVLASHTLQRYCNVISHYCNVFFWYK